MMALRRRFAMLDVHPMGHVSKYDIESSGIGNGEVCDCSSIITERASSHLTRDVFRGFISIVPAI
ncbi:MAG: hypothetical protein ACQ9MH_19685 [Nitrospinales bacterium]